MASSGQVPAMLVAPRIRTATGRGNGKPELRRLTDTTAAGQQPARRRRLTGARDCRGIGPLDADG